MYVCIYMLTRNPIYQANRNFANKLWNTARFLNIGLAELSAEERQVHIYISVYKCIYRFIYIHMYIYIDL